MEEEKDYNELEDFNINQKNRNNYLSKKQLIYIIISSLAIFIILAIIIIIVSIKKSNNNETLKCDPGYFVPEKEKICKKCSLENCKECYGTENLNFCTSCISSYIPIYLNNSIHICEKECEEGEGEKCKICNETKNQCFNCNDGYYIPDDSEKRQKCQKCSIENCEKCYGNKNSNFCISCGDYLEPIYIDNEIKECKYTCEEGKEDKCLTCDKIKNRCSTCNKGYYLSEDDFKCKKCSIENCEKCYGNSKSNTCTKCFDDFMPFYENNIMVLCDPFCQEGIKEKCFNCDKIKNQCSSCNIGYYLPEDDSSKKICKKCTIENCEKCYGNLDYNICENCISSYFPVYEENKIKKCEIMCETGENEKCLECDKTINRCSICNKNWSPSRIYL